jgi:Fe-S cluster assembly ATP-binding protein
MLEIKNLHVTVDGKPILKGLDLTVGAGEVHAIMGPNGSGKSTLAYVLAGREGYEVTDGAILYEGRNLLELKPEERAREGIFLAFQYPVEIPGVGSNSFLKAAVNAVRKHRGLPEYDAMEFLKLIREKRDQIGVGEDMLKRSLNVGFSGGEKKRAEVLQMTLLEPRLAILDETDSGLDIDALRIVADGIAAVREARPELGILLITHYQRLLNYITPDVVHVLAMGRIVKTGGKDLALRLESEGYGPILREAGLAPDVPDEALLVPQGPDLGEPTEHAAQTVEAAR